MSIVKKLVDVMNGSIEVETELGKETKFTLVLQHKVADNNLFLTKTDMSLVDEQQILQGKHVLLAEDNDLNAEIAIMILEAMGLIVEGVEDEINSNAFEEDRKMAISKGMNDHIAKPIDVKKVEEVIISVLK